MSSPNIHSRIWTEAAQADALKHLPPHTLTQDRRTSRAQHVARAWEYTGAMAAASESFQDCLWLDVGGAGSPLPRIVAEDLGWAPQIIDPEFNGIALGTGYWDEPLNKLWGKADFVSCISVLEHVKLTGPFLADLAALVAPGGLLYLTVDYIPEGETDTFHFHWMRERIYTSRLFYGVDGVFGELATKGFKLFGELNNTNWDPIPGLGYTFASLCMQKGA